MTETKNQRNNVLLNQVNAVRRFNRFYTRQIGVLQEVLLESEFSLTEVRVLYELNERTRATASGLGRDLSLDAGYLSRLLRKLEKKGLIARQISEGDARQTEIQLTTQGIAEFAELDTRSHNQIATSLHKLTRPEQGELLRAMAAVERLLGGGLPKSTAYVIRSPEPGDLGWIVHRHGALYAREFGWNEHFESLVARIVADYVQDLDPQRDRCWLAESEGEILGSVFLVHKDRSVAQLRLLLVEPSARGRGIGTRLVSECLRFARRAGYERISLWTNDVLTSARRLYEAAGFELVARERHTQFGPALEGQTWVLDLATD
jgi:DNA-binding MarR family transcriptional regulator/GNAT superfamily N-acetyltransferase